MSVPSTLTSGPPERLVQSQSPHSPGCVDSRPLPEREIPSIPPNVPNHDGDDDSGRCRGTDRSDGDDDCEPSHVPVATVPLPSERYPH